MRNTPAEFLDLATAVRASPFQTFWKIRFPAALPFVISGSKVAITLAVIGAVIGEFIGSNEGLGNLLLVANSQINIPLAFACLIGLAVIGIGLYAAVAAVELALKPWFGAGARVNVPHGSAQARRLSSRIRCTCALRPSWSRIRSSTAQLTSLLRRCSRGLSWSVM